jgi:hypothetical protein
LCLEVRVAVGLREAVGGLKDALGCLDARLLTGPQAVDALEVVTAAERWLAAARTQLAKRIDDTAEWRRHGDRSAAQYLAHKTGTDVGNAVSMLETAETLEHAPGTAAAFAAGEISESQAKVVAKAVAHQPSAEDELLDTAKRSSHKRLRDACRRVRHAGSDEKARYEAIKRDRYLRTWTDEEGAYCGQFRTTPDAGARIEARIRAEIDTQFAKARAEGRKEPLEAYAVDAVEALICTGGSAQTKCATVVNVLVDYDALLRGETGAGEVCEIAGIGPVPVELVHRWLSDAFLRLIVTHGVDVKATSRKTRYVDAEQKAALFVRDHGGCVIDGCNADRRLEMDHWEVPFADEGPTKLDNLALLCVFHHVLKTRKGFRLDGGPGHWKLVPPARAPAAREPA